MRFLRTMQLLPWFAAVLLWSGFSQAQQSADPTVRSAARKLGTEGMELFAEGEFEEALDKFNRADKLLPTPTLGIRAARCLAELGRYVEASERYLAVTRYAVGPGTHWSHRKAVRAASIERAEIIPKIGELTIAIDGPRGDGITVTLDGYPVPPELLDVAGPIDPGLHTVVVVRGDSESTTGTTADATVTEDITLADGESATLKLVLPALPAVEAPILPLEPQGWRTWEYVGFTTGAVGLGVLAVAAANGIAAAVLQSDLEGTCPNRTCPPANHGTADRYDAARAITTAGLIVGAVGVAVGVTLYFSADAIETNSNTTPPGTDATIFIGPGSANLKLRF